MSYRDPYNPPQAPQRYEQPYRDNDAYDPYYSNNTTTANYPAHPTYDQSGYRDADMDDEAYPNPSRFQEPRDTSPDATAVSGGEQKERSKYEAAGFPPALRPPKDTGAIRIWRQDFHGGMWTRGSRGRCIGRFCCCTLFLGVFLIASIVLTLLIWVRPPDVQINNVAFPTNGSAFQVTSTSLNINLGVNISVSNPNYFQVDLSKIKADLTYPINNLDVGGGQRNNIVFKSHTETTFNFPFTLTYNEQDDPNKTVLQDILSRCGITGQKRDLDINYKITLGIKVFFVTVSPSFSNTFSFECPVDANDLQALLKGAGISIPGVPST